MDEDRIERRSYQVSELRLVEGDDSRVIDGHAAVFNTLSEDLGGFREKIDPGAFAQTIRDDDVRALWNHQAGVVLGRSKNDTLSLSEDKIGLAFTLDVARTQAGDDALVSIKRGDVDQMSFGFRVQEEQWDEDHDKDETTRTLKVLQLLDISPVTFPAYPETDVAKRSLAAWHESQEPEAKKLAVQRRRVEVAEAEGK